ncbi:MAG: histidine--tRNA ligase [Candidatus Woesearchaeota archaeon]|nr:histidine--tRNA ligase [Candidatus Woesearchaeota archaeon]
MDVQLPRGMRDFSPEEKLFRDKVLGTFKTVFERFGFNPLETPVLERLDVLTSKFAGGEEILKEMFTLTDQGDRKLGLRYDMTVPLARYIGCNPNVKMPFKRYVIGPVYRDGPIKLGRYREFYQCDADIVGTTSVAADAQCIELALAVFKELGLDVRLVFNDRALLDSMLKKDGVAAEQLIPAILTLDKLKKIGEEGVRKELTEKEIPTDALDNVIRIAQLEPADRVQAILKQYGPLPALARVEGLRLKLQALYHGTTEKDRVLFDPSLARGLTYYTGTVFEVFWNDERLTSSLLGAGRYDNMISEFLGKPAPAVGISFGLEPIMEALKLQGMEQRKTVTDVYVIPIKTPTEAARLVAQLRDAGVNADLDLTDKGISKNLQYADALGIPYVVFLGKREIADGVCKLKDMNSGEETLLTTEELVARVT